MPLTTSAKLFVDIVRSSSQVARSPPAVATTKLNCWPCQTYRSLAMTGWGGIESFESQGKSGGRHGTLERKNRVSDGNGEIQRSEKGRDGSVDKKKLRTYFYPIHVRGINVHIDKALLWSPGRSTHFWNNQTPPNLKKTSAICRAGRDFIALRF
ncbi:hypothetical protein EV363DRAFT_1333234 [Boletus edulis]|nr:hypothetical protein EV363DRAFT_1333234 [Boletus edulis]